MANNNNNNNNNVQETRVILTLKDEKSVESITNDIQDTKTPNDVSSELLSTDKAAKTMSGGVGYQMAEQVISTTCSTMLEMARFNIERNMNLNDDYISQRNLSIARSQYQQVTNLTNGIINGFASGLLMSGGNFAVAGITAAIGSVSQGISMQQSIHEARINQNDMLRIMDAQLQFSRKNIGYSTQSGSIGEDL